VLGSIAADVAVGAMLDEASPTDCGGCER